MFRLLTFNAFLLDFHLRALLTAGKRVRLMAREIARLDPDVVVLQEVWGRRHRRRLAEDFRGLGYPHVVHHASPPPLTPAAGLGAGLLVGGTGTAAMRGRLSPGRLSRRRWLALTGAMLGLGSGAVLGDTLLRDYGNGLLVVSRLPLEGQARSLGFSVATRFEERFVHKGALAVGVKLPGAGWADLVATHLGARTYDFSLGRYTDETNAWNLMQLEELFAWIRTLRQPGPGARPLLLAGDLNFDPWTIQGGRATGEEHPGYRRLCAPAAAGGLGLKDAFAVVNGRGHPRRHTCCQLMQYALPRPHVRQSATEPPVRLDYICYTGEALRPVSCKVELADYLPERPDAEALKQERGWRELPPYLSDHFGLSAAFEIPAPALPTLRHPDTLIQG